MPSERTLTAAGLGLALVGLTGIAAAQPERSTGLSLTAEIGIRFVVSLAINLLIGGALVALGPDYAAERLEDLRTDAGGAFGWGLVVGILVPILLAILAVTIIGLVVAIPGAIVLFVVGIVGQAVTVVWIGHALAGEGDRASGRDAAVGALALAIPGAIPVLGNLITSILGFFGLGSVGRDLYRGWQG